MNLSGAEVGIGILALASAGALLLTLGRRARTPAPDDLASFSDCILAIAADGRVESIESPRGEFEPWSAKAETWRDLFHPDDHAAVGAALKRGNGSAADVRLRGARGEWRAGLLHWRSASSGGPTHGYFRAHESDPASAASSFGLAPFIAAVTHQLNNRLHLIRGFAELSIQHQAAPDADASDLARVNEVVDESAELLRQLSILAQETAPAARDLDLGEELGRLAHFAAPILGGRIGIRVEAPTEPLLAHVSPLPLQQAITALLILAAGNQGQRGEIVLSAKREAQDTVAVEIVAESGESSAHPATDDENQSLALALERLLACDAQLEMDSTENTRRLRILLPGEPGESPMRAAGGHGQNLLVVDASARERAQICEILEEEGYRTWEASGGSEALAMAESLDPLALLIVDLLLDSETGVEVRDRIVARHEGVPVLYTTSFPAVLGVGANDGDQPIALAKPYKREELIERVRAALAG